MEKEDLYGNEFPDKQEQRAPYFLGATRLKANMRQIS